MPEPEPVRPSPAGPALRPGEVLGERYRIVRLIGTGGMGAVYEAVHVRIERRFAIKMLHEERRDTGAARRFEREARIAGSLESRHIVPVIDFDRTADGASFLVMEFVPGEDLRRLLSREGGLSLRRAVNLLSQAASGVGAAHDRGIIHRDLKPSNLLVSLGRDGHELCQVSDFGVAREGDDLRALESAVTETGALIGTLAYMPPEQIRGEKLDVRADIYALGAILYECLAERRAFAADAPHTLIYKILHERPLPLSEIRPDLPERLLQVVERALSADRDARFQQIDEFTRALAASNVSSLRPNDEATDLDQSGSRPYLVAAPRRKRDLAILALAAAGIGGAVTAVALRPAPDARDAAAEVASPVPPPGRPGHDATPEPLRLGAGAQPAPSGAIPSESSGFSEPASQALPPSSSSAERRASRPARPAEAKQAPPRPSAPTASAAGEPPRLNPDAAYDPFAR